MCRSLMAVCVPGFNENVVLSAYADDVIVFTRNQRDVDILTSILSDFTTASEARVITGERVRPSLSVNGVAVSQFFPRV